MYNRINVFELEKEIEDISKKIEELDVDITDAEIEIEAQSEIIISAKTRKKQLLNRKKRLERKYTRNTDAFDTNKKFIHVGDTVRIINTVTHFSEWSCVKEVSDEVIRRRRIKSKLCDPDEFGVVREIELAEVRGKEIIKVWFVTDSGKETWRKPSNLEVRDDQRGIRCHERQIGGGTVEK